MPPPNAEKAVPGVSGHGSQKHGHAEGRDTSRDSNNSQNIKPKCKRCGRAFKRERVEQKYCNARCRNAAVKARLRARSGDKKPSKRHLVLPHREAVTFGQKTPTKSKAIFDPLACNFQAPGNRLFAARRRAAQTRHLHRNPEVSTELSPAAAQR